MDQKPPESKSTSLLPWFVAFLVTVAAFYLMNHLVMGMQDLPLAWDLSPAQ